MKDYTHILNMLNNLQLSITHIKDELGRMQAQASVTFPETNMIATKVSPAILPPTASEVEIVGGDQTDQFPDCCAVGNEQRYFCSGTLIAPNLVVTADHCRDITHVFLGGNDISRPDQGELLHVVNQFSHPEVDLSVLVLERDSQVFPRSVAQVSKANSVKTVTLAGFGTIDVHGTVGYGVKRKVEVPVITFDCSEPGTFKEYGCLAGREIVAGHSGLLLDSCQGDSGGPLYIQHENGTYYLLGATSRGTRHRFTSCGDGGIYVRVDLCLDWISMVTGTTIASVCI